MRLASKQAVRRLIAWTFAIALVTAHTIAAPAEDFEATAYSNHGVTASGEPTRRGTAAADPSVLPLGTRVRVTGAGRYSGEYVVRDTGREVDGHTIDIFVPDERAAKRFGRRQVKVEVVRWGDGSATSGRR